MRSGGHAYLIDCPLAHFRGLDNLEERFHYPVDHHADAAGRRFGQIGDTSRHGRAAIVHGDLHAALVLEIGDAHARTEWQRPVRHGERAGIEWLATRGLLAGEIIAVHRNAATLLRAYLRVAG